MQSMTEKMAVFHAAGGALCQDASNHGAPRKQSYDYLEHV